MAEVFDTHAAFRDLTDGGRFTPEQAEAMVALVSNAITGNLATKSDLENLETRLNSRIDALEVKFEGLEVKFEALESKFAALESKFAALESKFEAMQARVWKVAAGAVVIIVALVKALDYILPGIPG